MGVFVHVCMHICMSAYTYCPCAIACGCAPLSSYDKRTWNCLICPLACICHSAMQVLSWAVKLSALCIGVGQDYWPKVTLKLCVVQYMNAAKDDMAEKQAEKRRKKQVFFQMCNMTVIFQLVTSKTVTQKDLSIST